MKKALAIILVITALMPLAAAGKIGLTVGPAWGWALSETFRGARTTSLVVSADGANYFGRTGDGFGVDYGLGVNILLNTFYQGIIYNESDASLTFHGGLAYRYALSGNMAVNSACGLNGDIIIKEGHTEFALGLYGNTDFEYEFTDWLSLAAGVQIGINLVDSIIDSGGSYTEAFNAFFLSPYVTISYLY